MNFTEKAKSKFWYDLSEGIKATFGHALGESFHIDQFKTGRFTFTESVTGGPGAVTLLMDKLKASSPVIESVRMTPISNGYNATYNVSVEFDPVKAESVYSNGKDDIRTIEKNGKTYIVDPDGTAHPIEGSGDEFVNNFNKSTGSRYQKKSEGISNSFKKDADSVFQLVADKLADYFNDQVPDISSGLATGVTYDSTDNSFEESGNSMVAKATMTIKVVDSNGSSLEDLEGSLDDLAEDIEYTIEQEFFNEAEDDFEDCTLDITFLSSSNTDSEWVRDINVTFKRPTGASESKKSESNLDEDGFPIDLDSVVALANEALEGTGASIAQEDGNLVIRGEADIVKPTQQYLPEPSYEMDSLEGGYDDETGDLSVAIPDYPSDIELEQLREFLINAVNYIIDNALCKADTCSDDEWCKEMDAAEPNENYVTQYGYKGDSFVGESKHKVAVLVKSLLTEGRIEEAKQVATKHMDAEMAEGFARKYGVKKVEESHKVILPDEMAMLDRLHETAMDRAPEKVVEMDSLVAKNMFKN